MRWPRQSAGLGPAALFSLLFVLPSAAFAQASPAQASPAQVSPAQPLDPITAIVNAFKTHDVVALDEGNHGNEQGAALRKALYHDARFLAAVNDIVVESGNGRHQAMMDRYISGGDVPQKELRMAWLETTQPTPVWDKDIYPDMFRTIREINQKLPKAKQLRVLLGDAPYTYDPSNPGKPIDRPESFPANLILHEVIAKKHKALIVYGGMHYLRRGPGPPPVPGQPAPPRSGSIVNQLENAGVKVFSIWTFTSPGQDLTALQADIANWPKPSLTLIKDTTLGVAPFTFYYPKGLGRITRLGPNGPVAIDLGEEIGGVMQEQFDALLYLGPKSEITYAGLQKSLCAEPDYVEMRANRLSAMRPPGAPATGSSPAADAFRMQCKEAVEGPRTTASPGTEAVLRRIVDGFIKGQPDLDEMAPGLVNAVNAQWPGMRPTFAKLGALTALTFKGVGPGGADIYEADFEHGQTEWRIAPLGADGKVAGLTFLPAAPGAPLPSPHPMSVSWPVLNLAPRMLTAGAQDYWPCFSPDGKAVLFSRSTDNAHWALYVVPAGGGAARPLITTPLAVSATRAAWSKSGMIAFTGDSASQTAIWLVAADGSGAHAVPTPMDGSQQLVYPSWYPDGTHVAAMDGKNLVIQRVDLASGVTTRATDHAQVLTGMPSVSPDGTMIAFAGQKNAGHPYNQEENVIWLVDAAGKLSTLEAKPIQGRAPVWSPDGKYLSFESDRGPSGKYAIFIVKRDGTGLTQLTDYILNANHGVFSPDGKHMVFAAMDPASRQSRIAIVDLPER